MYRSVKTISILGCGWYGLPLAKALIQAGYKVKGSTTTASKLHLLESAGVLPYLIDLTSEEQRYDVSFFDCDILWISIPPKSRQGEAGGYFTKIERIVHAAIQHGVKQVVFISSTSVYGDVNKEVNEQDTPLPDTEAGRVILSVEQFLQQQANITSTIIRFGGLIGPDRNPGRFFAGKKDIPNGLSPVNLIHLTDCVGLSMAILQQQAYGRLYNACAPHHPAKASFYTKAALNSGLQASEFINELLQWKIVESVYISPVLNYNYQISNWDEWLNISK